MILTVKYKIYWKQGSRADQHKGEWRHHEKARINLRIMEEREKKWNK